jgi:hypothetical protein
MKKIYIILVLLSSSFFAQGQTFEWVRTFGSTGADSGNSSVIDAAGNVYTTGTFRGTFDADLGAGTTILTGNAGGGVDFYITKFDATGTFVWAKKLGGSDNDQAYSMTVDASGNIYLAGYFAYLVDFDPNAGVHNMGAAGVGSQQGFLLKLDSNGNFVWSKELSTSNVAGNQVIVTSITVDANDNIIAGGYFKGVYGDETVAFTSISASIDFFVVKYSSTGTYQWTKRVGSSGNESVTGLATDSNGNVFVSGNFASVVDFDPSAVTQNLGPVGGTDAFLLKLDGTGSYQWAKNVGGLGEDYGRNVTVNSANEIYLAGNFNGTVNFALTTPANNITSNGSTDNFIVKFDGLSNVVWAKTFGGTGAEYISSVTCDTSGNVFSTGYFNGTVDFDSSASVTNLIANGGYDVFILKLNSSGDFVNASRFGGSGSEHGSFIKVDANNKIYTTGNFDGTCYFNPNSTTADFVASQGSTDGFVHKMIDPSLGTESFNNLEKIFSVYPNPNNGLFNLTTKIDANYSIVNALGQVLQKGKVEFGSNIIDIQNQPNGLYFLQFNDRKALKIIKK